jgi:hypothetical protein
MSIDKSIRQHYDVPETKKIKGQLHKLAYITNKEAELLQKFGGQKVMTPEKIPAYPGHHGSSGSSAGVSQGGGGHGGGGEGPRGGHHHPPARPTPVTTAVASPSILSRPTPKPAHLGDTGFITPTEPIRHHSVDTPIQIKEQIDLDKAKEERETKFDEDWDFENRKIDQRPLYVRPKYEEITIHGKDGSYTKTQPVKYSPTYYQDRSKIGGKTYGERVAQDMKQYQGSGLGTLGKILLTGATAGAGAGLFGKDIANIANVAKWVGRGKDIKEGTGIYGKAFNLAKKGLDKSNLTSTIQKAADLRSRPKGMPEHLGERGFRTRDDTARDGDGIQTAITGDKGLLTEGAKTLGITDEQREQYMLIQKKMKNALGQGSYINQQGETIQLNEQQIEQLQNYINNLDKILQTTLQTAAHGGRIDRPLMGGSRYI